MKCISNLEVIIKFSVLLKGLIPGLILLKKNNYKKN